MSSAPRGLQAHCLVIEANAPIAPGKASRADTRSVQRSPVVRRALLIRMDRTYSGDTSRRCGRCIQPAAAADQPCAQDNREVLDVGRFLGLFCQPASGFWRLVAVPRRTTESAESPINKGNPRKQLDAGGGTRTPDTRIMITTL